MRRNDITKKIIYGLYNKQYLSKKEAALRLNCNITTIHKKMLKFGIATRGRSESVKIAKQKIIINIPKKKLEKLYLVEKLSIQDISKRLHYCKEIIKRELKNNRIPLRNNIEAISLAWEKIKIKKSLLVKLYCKDKLTQKKIANKIGSHHAYISVLMKKYKIETRKPDFYHTKYKKYNFDNNLKEKSYLIGFRLGDLYAKLLPSKKLLTVSTTSTKIEQIDLFKRLFKKYGNVWVSKKRKDGNMVCVVILNRSFDFLLNKQDNIHKWIRNNKKYLLSFLAGYTDAEGCIFINKNNTASFTLSSYDNNILKQIYLGLLKMGVKCNPPKIRVKRGHTTKKDIIYKKNLWYFTTNKKSSLLKILKLLKPLLKHSKRLKDLKNAEKNIIKRAK